MPYYKPNGQPAFDSEFDGGAGASLQKAAGNPAPDAASSGAATIGPAPVPAFEDIIGGVTDASGSSTPDTATITATTTQIISSSGSGLVFNNTFGSGATPAFINEVDAAETYLQSLFGNSCTVNCSFDVQSLNPNFSGENSFQPVSVSYSQFVNALKSHASTPTAVAAANALSNLADPTGGQGVEVSIGEALILGLPINTRINPDDAVILNSVYWTPNALQNNPGDAEAVIEHELTEGIMGRIGSLGIADVQWAPMDFFRYTASGQRDFTGGRDGRPTYFSADGTNVDTGLQYHNSVSTSGRFDGFDFADWDGVGADSNDHDPFGPGGPGNGDPGTLSATDIQIMEALGWAPPVTTTAEMITTDASGNYYIYDLGSNAIQGSNLLQNLGTGFRFGGIGNFGGDRGDMMLRASNGDIDIYDISNNQITGTHDLGAVGLDWTIAGFGDFSGNAGETDMIMRQSSGALELYDISNNQVTFATSLGNFGTNTVAGFGDFSGHAGETDMMMRSSAGDLIVYDMSNNSVTSGPIDLGGVGLDWVVYGFGDFSSNPNETDLVMRSTTTGSFELYDISNNRVVNAQALGAVGSEWTLAGFGDFSGNPGETDMMLRNSSTGGFEVYDIANNRIYNAAPAGQVTLSQAVSGVGPDVPISDTSLSASTSVAAGSTSANTTGGLVATNAGADDSLGTSINDVEIAPPLDSFFAQGSPAAGWVADAGLMNAAGGQAQPAAGATNDLSNVVPPMSGFLSAPVAPADLSPVAAGPNDAPAMFAAGLLQHTG